MLNIFNQIVFLSVKRLIRRQPLECGVKHRFAFEPDGSNQVSRGSHPPKRRRTRLSTWVGAASCKLAIRQTARLRYLLAVLCLFLVSQIYPIQAQDPDLAPLVSLITEVDDTQFQLDILRGLSEALEGRPSVPMPDGWNAVESKFGDSETAELRALVQSLSLKFGSARARATLRNILQDGSARDATRLNALNSLLQAQDEELPPILLDLLATTGMRGPAIRALARYNDPETPGSILGVYDQLSIAERRDALTTLSSRTTFAIPLLAAVEQGTISSKDLTAELIRQLRSFNNVEIDRQIQAAWGSFRETTANKKAEIQKFRGIYRAGGSTPGDAVRGRVVYVRACAQCHTLFNVGGKVGPDITGSDRRNLDYILENIVDPNAVIPNDYRASTIETTDDRFLTGIVKRRDANTVTIQTANETLIIPKEDVVEIHQSELSMMPEDLLAPLTDQEIRDLIYYLRQDAQAPLMATTETVDMFFNGQNLAGWDGDENLWRVTDGEMIGKTEKGLNHNAFLASQMIVDDFRLICQVKLAPNSENSGIQFRSEPLPDGEVKGYQADVGQGWWGKLYEERGRALLWEKGGEAHVKPNEWNTYEILAVGSKIRTAINGNLCVDLDDPDGAERGIIAFQIHSGGPMEVRFKEFELETNPEFRLKTVR